MPGDVDEVAQGRGASASKEFVQAANGQRTPPIQEGVRE